MSPEINHTSFTPVTGPTVASKPAEVAKAVATAATDPAVSADQLEAAVRAVLIKNSAKAREAAKPREPDWATLTEQQSYSQDIYIPAIEHEIPDYMNMKLKDPEYECVWASRDQRRIGQLMAIGYEMLRPEHVDRNFPLPLLFDSEGMYVYVDVVAMRVHKRILYGKRRKALQVSLNQLANRNKPPRVRLKNSYDLSADVEPSYGKLYSDIV